MKLETKAISSKISPIIQKVKEYGSFAGIIIILGLFGFVVLRIRTYATQKPSQESVDTVLLTLNRSKIDQDTIEKLEQLESSSVDVKALFDQARDNPFQE